MLADVVFKQQRSKPCSQLGEILTRVPALLAQMGAGDRVGFRHQGDRQTNLHLTQQHLQLLHSPLPRGAPALALSL